MNSSAINQAARATVVVIVLGLAAAFGLVVGNAIQSGPSTNAGYPAGYQGGAAVPASKVASATFSLEALEALRAARGDDAAPTPDASMTRPTPR